MLFGWFGAISYIVIIVYLIYKLFSSLKYQNEKFYSITIGLLILWVVFLIDEYKVNATALPHYHLLIWLLLGYSYGIINNNDNLVEEGLT